MKNIDMIEQIIETVIPVFSSNNIENNRWIQNIKSSWDWLKVKIKVKEEFFIIEEFEKKQKIRIYEKRQKKYL